MTTETESEETPRREMTCVRRLYVLTDEAGLTWLAAEEGPDDGPAEGGAMSHFTSAPAGDETSGRPEGGAMSHLLPGGRADVEGDDPDRVTIVVPPSPGGLPHRLQAYRVSSALLPDGVDPSGA